MKAIKITEKVLDYINKNKHRFELETPELGEIWMVADEKTYPTACDGEPIVEVENDNDAWMRLPAKIVEVFEFDGETKHHENPAPNPVNKKQVAGLVNLIFDDKHVFLNKEKGTVAVETIAQLKPNNYNAKCLSIFSLPIIRSLGIAKVSPEDKFDEKRGYLIASSRSENEAYHEDIEILKGIKKEAKQIMEAVDCRIEILRDCIEHNKQFIRNVADGK